MGLGIKIRPNCGEAVAFRQVRRTGEAVNPRPASPETIREDSDRRAKSLIRRLCVEHGLTRLLTLTFREGETDRSEVVTAIQRFVRRARKAYPDLRLVAVLELHADGERWHAHCAVNKWVSKGEWAALWGAGFIDIRLLRTRTKGRRAKHGPARQAAHYLAKYVAKATASGARGKGEHRYYRSQDMPVLEVEAVVDSWEEAEALVLRWFEKKASYWWVSWAPRDGKRVLPFDCIYWVFDG